MYEHVPVCVSLYFVLLYLLLTTAGAWWSWCFKPSPTDSSSFFFLVCFLLLFPSIAWLWRSLLHNETFISNPSPTTMAFYFESKLEYSSTVRFTTGAFQLHRFIFSPLVLNSRGVTLKEFVFFLNHDLHLKCIHILNIQIFFSCIMLCSYQLLLPGDRSWTISSKNFMRTKQASISIQFFKMHLCGIYYLTFKPDELWPFALRTQIQCLKTLFE